MKIIKTCLCLIFVFSALLNYPRAAAMAQEAKDSIAVKKVIKNYLDDFYKQDLKGVMSHVSPGYSDKDKNGNIIDYAMFESISKNYMLAFSNKNSRYSFTDLQFIKMDFQGDRAVVQIEFTGRRLNLEASEERTEIVRRLVSLIEEDDTWKIVRYGP